MPVTGDGPSLEQYIETRLNLLNEVIVKVEASFDRRFGAMEEANTLVAKGVDERFAHHQQLSQTLQQSAQLAIDKAERAQSAHNVAANEWRGTLNDFKSTLVSRAEFDRLSSDFAAYKLEAARLFSAAAGEKTGSRETKDDSKSMLAIVIAVATAAVTLITFALTHLK